MTPEGWEPVLLGDIFREVVDTGHEEDLPVLSVTLDRGVVRRDSLDRKMGREVERRTYRRVEPGDIAYNTMRMWQGGSGLARETGYVSPAYIVVRGGDRDCPEFWAHAFKEPRLVEQFRLFSQGFAKDRHRLYFNLFGQIPVLRPPLPEQRKIASILSSIDEAIEKNCGVLEQSQVVYCATRERLLAEGMPNRHRSFRQTTGGRVPSSWSETTLNAHLAEPIRNGYSPVCPTEPTGLWTLSLAAVTPEGFDPRGIKPAPQGDDRVGAAMLRIGDVVISRSNTRERVGLAGVYRGDPSSCSYPDLLMRIRPSATLSPDFLELLLLSERGRSYFMRCARGTSGSMIKIDRGIVAAFPIDLPSLEEQKEITEIISGVQAQLRTERAHIDGLRDLKLTLMSALLSGDLRVTPDEVAA